MIRYSAVRLVFVLIPTALFMLVPVVAARDGAESAGHHDGNSEMCQARPLTHMLSLPREEC
jgi:hypothetical protein